MTTVFRQVRLTYLLGGPEEIEVEYKSHKEFFEKAGEEVLHPKSYGECFYPVTVEELYQHFKARLQEETIAEQQEADEHEAENQRKRDECLGRYGA